MTRIITALLLSLFAMATPAHAWWEKDWKYRKAVTVDTSPSGVNMSGAVGRTVVLVRLHSGNFTFTEASTNGADLRLVDSDDKTPLPFHIERFDAQNGLASLWVSVPNVNGGEKRLLWLYFGNDAAPVAQDAAGTFDPDHLAVYHFSQNQGQPVGDSTANNNGTANAPAGVNDGGIIGRSARFPGQGALQIAASPSLAMPAGAPLTFTTWVKPDQIAGEAALLTRGNLVIGLNAGVPFAAVGAARVQGSTALRQGEYSHFAMVADGQNIRLYVNGVEAGAGAGALPALDGPLLLGGGEGRPFTGELDESRLSKTARPAAMLMAMAQAEGANGKLVGVSEAAEEQSEGGGTFFYVVSRVETIDAIIIGILMLLLLAAIAVIVSKTRYVGAAERGNAAFLRRFRQMDQDLVPLKDVPDISPAELKFTANSPLGRIYEVGIEELEIRRKRWGRATPLTGEAVAAMRAATDAVVVTENQKLDSWMVILTIAIAGGPFIGLLGTVMGVMNTFGGVAIAGDVNVNAIAPGIAAALLATIAGLACAIPALFAYNYLNTKITSIADEMRVFVDRLITRMAEVQRGDATPPPMRMAAE